MSDNLVEIRNLTKYFEASHEGIGANISRWLGNDRLNDGEGPESTQRENQTLAVDDLSFSITRGTVIGLVGESGSGKSTVARCLLRLIEPSAGDVQFEGQSVLNLRRSELKQFRQKAQMVFQDPTASLDPRFTVKRTLAEPLRVHQVVERNEREQRIRQLMEDVHLREDHINRYPHQLSGGERQRVVIARALATNPSFLVLDEPTSALDVSVQVHILQLLKELKERFDMSYLVISHDLGVIRHLCERVIVMYLGRAIEVAETSALIHDPKHPYTLALMSAIPIPDPDYEQPRIRLKGDIRDSSGSRDRCSLANRCHMAVDVCHHTPQNLVQIEEGRWVACHRVSNGEISSDAFQSGVEV